MQSEQITRVVLTGGPCAGKTTAVAQIVDHFSRLGYKVFTVPEIPTMVTKIGWSYLTDNEEFYYYGEKMILELQLEMENKVLRLAETIKGQPCLVVCDRGLMDISTYVSEEIWAKMCEEVGMTSSKMRQRYDAVLHLLSAANGTEECYTTANNAQRYEKADEAGLALARELDRKQAKAWEEHPCVRVIENVLDFDVKMNHVINELESILG